MSAVIPLERWPLAREKWRLEVDDHNLTVITPHLEEPWAIPVTSIAGVCDLWRQTELDDELTLVREANLLEMETKASIASSNLLVVLKRPQGAPRRARFMRRAGRNSKGAKLDGFSVQTIDSEGCASVLADHGVKRFPSQRDALLAAIGGVPISALPEPEQRRVRRRERLRTIATELVIALVVAFIVARVAFNVSALERVEALLVMVFGVAVLMTLFVVAYVRRQDHLPITTGRAPPSRPIQ
jgi:hypothetical protein